MDFLPFLRHTVNVLRNPAPVEVGSLSNYLQSLLHPRCRISEASTVSSVQNPFDQIKVPGILISWLMK